MSSLKFSQRILSLKELVLQEEFHSVFDTCCDHGLIGKSFLNSSLIFKKLIFVDKLSHLISQLDISGADIPKRNILLEKKVEDIRKLQFEKEDLVIMAGIGGDLILEAIGSHQKEGLSPKYYLISAHTKHLMVRKQLEKLGLKRVREKLVFESGIYYDHLLVSYQKGQSHFPINQTGEKALLAKYYQSLKEVLEIKAKFSDPEASASLSFFNNLGNFYKKPE